VALFPDQDGCTLNKTLLTTKSNRLADLVPEYAQYGTVVQVIDLLDSPMQLLADIVSQQVVCLFP
jgi:hypothetical protein